MEDIKEIEEECCGVDLELEQISLVEEYKRIEKQDSELVIPSEIKTSNVYKHVEEETYAIANGFRILLNAGVDYNNAMTISQSSAIGFGNKETVKYQSVQQQNTQI